MMTDSDTRQAGAAIRAARPEEAGALSALALRSKGHWGYDADFLEACRADLALSPAEIATTTVYLIEGIEGIAGYYRIIPRDDSTAELDALFVDPAAIGKGAGRRLWEHAVSAAREMGCRELVIQSDPHAEGFYQAMGARRSGESASTVTPGRMLPLLRFVLDDRAGGA